jgi:hypothetical protein
MGGRFQSALQDANSRLKGSVVLEIAAYNADSVSTLAGSTAGTDAISWVNVGSVSGVNMTENIPTAQLQGDNALEEKTATDQTVTLAFNQREALSEDAREVLRGSFDTSGTPVAGDLVEDAEQVIASGAWGYNDPIVIENQNYDLSAVTVVSLAGSTNDTLVADTDYFVGQDALGRTVITIIDSDTIATLSQSMTITYDYTPYASQTTYTGGKTTLPYLMARLSNTDEDDYLYRVWLYRGSIDSGYSFAFKSDVDSDPVVPNAVSITFICDQSLERGYQLMKDYKERGI